MAHLRLTSLADVTGVHPIRCAAFFERLPAQVIFRQGPLADGALRAGSLSLRAGGAPKRAHCAPATHFDAGSMDDRGCRSFQGPWRPRSVASRGSGRRQCSHSHAARCVAGPPGKITSHATTCRGVLPVVVPDRPQELAVVRASSVRVTAPHADFPKINNRKTRRIRYSRRGSANGI